MNGKEETMKDRYMYKRRGRLKIQRLMGISNVLDLSKSDMPHGDLRLKNFCFKIKIFYTIKMDGSHDMTYSRDDSLIRTRPGLEIFGPDSTRTEVN